mgnify:CR=1 FL=1
MVKISNNNINIFEPLIDSLFQVGKVLFTKRLPNYIDYQIDNNIYVNDMYIPIGINKKGIQYLHIGGENAHTYIVGNTGSGKSTLATNIAIYEFFTKKNYTWLIDSDPQRSIATFLNIRNDENLEKAFHFSYKNGEFILLNKEQK